LHCNAPAASTPDDAALDLTTHGLGIDGAREAAKDLIALWVEGRNHANEKDEK
jgi:predicted RNase H-like HicB family nuclease